MSKLRRKTAIGLGIDDGQTTFNEGGLGEATPRGGLRNSFGMANPQWQRQLAAVWGTLSNQGDVIADVIRQNNAFADGKGYAVNTRGANVQVAGPSQNPVRPRLFVPHPAVDWLDTFAGASVPLFDHLSDTGQAWVEVVAFDVATQVLTINGDGTLFCGLNAVYHPYVMNEDTPFDKMVMEIDWLPQYDDSSCLLVSRSNNSGLESTYEDVHAGLLYSGTPGIYNTIIASYAGSSVYGGNVSIDIGQYQHLIFTIDDTLTLNVNGTDEVFSPNTDFPASGKVGLTFTNTAAFGPASFAANFAVTWIRS